MASWVLGCLNCQKEFVYANINEDRFVDYMNQNKPEMPTEGREVGCPNCGHQGLYTRNSLFYCKG